MSILRRAVAGLAMACIAVAGLVFTGQPANAASVQCTTLSTRALGTTFNPCAVLDLSQVRICDSTGCYGYCAATKVTRKVWCASKHKYIDVPVWLKVYPNKPYPYGCR